MFASTPSDYVVPALALLGTVFGGAGLKFIDSRYAFREKKTDLTLRLHDELMDEVRNLKTSALAVELRMGLLQKAYYIVLIKYNLLRERQGMPPDLDDKDLELQMQKLTDDAAAADLKKTADALKKPDQKDN